MNPDTELGGAGRGFPSTSWSIMKDLRGASAPDREEALQRLIARYWKPVYCVIRYGWKKGNEEAKDLTQEFFLVCVLERSLTDAFSPAQGSFRTFLKASLANFLRDGARFDGRQKRGGGGKILRLDLVEVDPSELLADPAATAPDALFDSAWKNELLGRAIQRLEGELKADGKAAYFDVFRAYDLEPDGAQVSYQTVGTALGLGSDTVKNYLTHARRLLRRITTELVTEYVGSEEELAAEMRELFGA